MSRKQSREIVFRLLFGLSPVNEQTLDIVCDKEKPQGPELEYIKSLCNACVDNVDAIDDIIKKYSHDFSFDRIFKTDLTALRMGIAEIKFFNGTPTIVAVNEAVEIAKKYGTEKSGAYVNGILAAVIK